MEASLKQALQANTRQQMNSLSGPLDVQDVSEGGFKM